MSKFDILTKYMTMIQVDIIGEWVFDKENDGTPERPIQMAFVNYSEMMRNFINNVCTFEENDKDMELTRYSDILKENGLESVLLTQDEENSINGTILKHRVDKKELE